MKQENYPAVYSPPSCIEIKGGERIPHGMNATITFWKCVQDLTDAPLAVARLYFSVLCEGKRYDDMLVEICERENSADSEVTTRAIEISRPMGSFNLPWPDDAFTSAVEAYYDKILEKRRLLPAELLSLFPSNVVTCADSHEIEIPDEPPPTRLKWRQRLGRWIGLSRDKS